MTDFIIRAFRGGLVSVHVKAGEYQPPAGEEADRLQVYHVLGAPDGASFGDVVDIFRGLMDPEAPPRFIWPWEAFIRREPLGEAYDAEGAGRLFGMSAWTVRKFIRERRLPASRERLEEFRRGELAYRINGHDLRWVMAGRSPVGRPRRAKGDGGEG
jgi:hypothetical protein